MKHSLLSSMKFIYVWQYSVFSRVLNREGSLINFLYPERGHIGEGAK